MRELLLRRKRTRHQSEELSDIESDAGQLLTFTDVEVVSNESQPSELSGSYYTDGDYDMSVISSEDDDR